MILFDGEYREREINIYFAINPNLEQLTYSQIPFKDDEENTWSLENILIEKENGDFVI